MFPAQEIMMELGDQTLHLSTKFLVDSSGGVAGKLPSPFASHQPTFKVFMCVGNLTLYLSICL